MRRSARKPIAILALIVFLTVWIWAAASIGSTMTGAPQWVQLGFYLVAGLAWVLPLRPLFFWMNSGPE